MTTTLQTAPSTFLAQTTGCDYAARLRIAIVRTFLMSDYPSTTTAEWLKAVTREEAPFPTTVFHGGGHYDDGPPKSTVHMVERLTRCPRHCDLCRGNL